MVKTKINRVSERHGRLVVLRQHDAEIKRFGDLAFKGDDGDERFTS